MRWQLIKNNIRRNKLINFSIFVFMAVSCVLFAVTICLTIQLTGSISHLMTIAKTPDFLQMHAGELDTDMIKEFANGHQEVRDYQINTFLNIDSSKIYLADHSLAGSSQDNGVCIQSERFDFLVDMNDEILTLQQGEVGVPVCYMRQYGLDIGDIVTIGENKFEITGFIRDSQMNSMMASSKRFLICSEDYKELMDIGEEEYLIEFLLEEDSNPSVFSTEYMEAGLPKNGPCITESLILMMNALSDGIMIMLILFASILVLVVALLCIRFIVYTGLKQDQKQVGMLKALGISKKDIRRLYFAKYIAISAVAAVFGICTSIVISNPLGRQIKELYGNGQSTGTLFLMAIAGTLLIAGITLLSIWKMLKKTEKMSALAALFDICEKPKKKRAFKGHLPVIFLVAIGTILMVVPFNILSTISAPEFVNYMGIGSGEIRLDIRQCEDIATNAYKMSRKLNDDPRVDQFVRLDTIVTRIRTKDNTEVSLMTEYGDHLVFPVSYSKGEAPSDENQIALSLLNSEDLGLEIGDKIDVIMDEETREFEVCGIYSDITNGGKTAKIADTQLAQENNRDITWSIFYVSLIEEENRNAWIAEYTELAQRGMELKVADIASYVNATFGQTMEQVQMATTVAMTVSAGILVVILLLFSRMQITNDRKDISLRKALGFKGKEIAVQYEKGYIYSILLGIVIGEIIGFLMGSKLAGIMLQSLGADGFRFILNLPVALIGIPLLISCVCAIAVKCGVHEIRNVKPAECVTGRE